MQLLLSYHAYENFGPILYYIIAGCGPVCDRHTDHCDDSQIPGKAECAAEVCVPSTVEATTGFSKSFSK